MSDTSGEDWLAMRLADVGKPWKEDSERLKARIAGLERANADYIMAAVDNYRQQIELGIRAAALGLATARIRELEGERDELLGLLKLPFIDGCHLTRWEEDPEGTGLGCASDPTCREHRRRAIVARIEKATK